MNRYYILYVLISLILISQINPAWAKSSYSGTYNATIGGKLKTIARKSAKLLCNKSKMCVLRKECKIKIITNPIHSCKITSNVKCDKINNICTATVTFTISQGTNVVNTDTQPLDLNCECVGECNDEVDDGAKIGATNPGVCDIEKLVELSNFTANPANKGISLNWTTKSESDSQGFKMWRAIPKLDSYCGCSGNIEDYTQIQVLDKKGKPVLIPAKGSTTSGYDYSYLDEDAKPGIAYCYALEDVDSKGESKFYFEYVAFTPDGLEETQ
jgi:hypothetical protein